MRWIDKLFKKKGMETESKQTQVPNVITLLYLPDGTLQRIVSSQINGQLDLLAVRTTLINALGQIDMALRQTMSRQVKKNSQDEDAP